jgi:hypothetical protein
LTGDQGYRAYLKQVREATGEPVGHRKGGVDDGEDSNSDDDDTDYGDDPMDGGAGLFFERNSSLKMTLIKGVRRFFRGEKALTLLAFS